MKTINKVLLGMGIVALILILLLGFYVFYVVPGLSPSMEPLRFSIHNWDESKHDVRVEIFDSNNKTSFNKSYSIEPSAAFPIYHINKHSTPPHQESRPFYISI